MWTAIAMAESMRIKILTIPSPDPPPTFDNSETKFPETNKRSPGLKEDLPDNHSRRSHSTGLGQILVTCLTVNHLPKQTYFIHFMSDVQDHHRQEYSEVYM